MFLCKPLAETRAQTFPLLPKKAYYWKDHLDALFYAQFSQHMQKSEKGSLSAVYEFVQVLIFKTYHEVKKEILLKLPNSGLACQEILTTISSTVVM